MPRFDVPARKTFAIFVRTGAAGKPMIRKEPYNVVEVDYGDGTPIQTYVELSCGLGLSRGVERAEVYDDIRIYDSVPFPRTQVGYGGPGQ